MCNYFKIQSLVKEKKSFKGFSIFSSFGLDNFDGGLTKEHSCEIISKSVHGFSRETV